MQALEALLDERIEADRFHPAFLRIGAARHLRDDGREGVAGERDTRDVNLGRQDLHRMDLERPGVNGNNDTRSVDGRTTQRRGEGGGDAGSVDRGIGAASSRQVLDGRDDIAVRGIEHARDFELAKHRTPRRRRVAENDVYAATAEREVHTDTDRSRAVNDRRLARFEAAALGGAPRDRHGLDQCALLPAHAGWQLVRHRSTHDGVLCQAATRTVVAVKGEQAAMVVAARKAIETVATGLDGLDGDAIADLEILDLRTQRHDLVAELVAQDHGVLDTGQRVRIARARRDGTVVV